MTDEELREAIDKEIFGAVTAIGVREEGAIVDLDTLIIDRQKATDALLSLFRENEREVKKVVEAFTIKGSHPDYHDQQLRRLETEWPSLYFALKELSNPQSKELTNNKTPTDTERSK